MGYNATCFGVCGVHGYLGEVPRNNITNGWLERELSSEAAHTAGFRVVAVHVPPFCVEV